MQIFDMLGIEAWLLKTSHGELQPLTLRGNSINRWKSSKSLANMLGDTSQRSIRTCGQGHGLTYSKSDLSVNNLSECFNAYIIKARDKLNITCLM